jgi:hypothetical protein
MSGNRSDNRSSAWSGNRSGNHDAEEGQDLAALPTKPKRAKISDLIEIRERQVCDRSRNSVGEIYVSAKTTTRTARTAANLPRPSHAARGRRAPPGRT